MVWWSQEPEVCRPQNRYGVDHSNILSPSSVPQGTSTLWFDVVTGGYLHVKNVVLDLYADIFKRNTVPLWVLMG